MRYAVDHDYHIHSGLSLCSGDPEQTPERMLRYAEDEGLKTICITDHFWDESIACIDGWYKKQGCKFYLGGDAHRPKDFATYKAIMERAVTDLDLTENDKFYITR